MKSAYGTDLAYIHHIGYRKFVGEATPGLLSLLRRNGITSGLVVDLGCGPGMWAQELTRRGYHALGIDISPAMIALARKAAPRAQFKTGSFLKLTLPPCVAVTALGEVLNYTFDHDNRRQELARLFRRVYEALRPGGVFIFDVAGPRREIGRAPQRWSVGKDWAILLDVSRDRDLLTRRMTVFRKLGKTYRRSQEVHQLRLYRSARILQELRRAGLVARTTRAYGTAQYRGLTAFIARRP
jgi:SAM-dependent methyltransferase